MPSNLQRATDNCFNVEPAHEGWSRISSPGSPLTSQSQAGTPVSPSFLPSPRSPGKTAQLEGWFADKLGAAASDLETSRELRALLINQEERVNAALPRCEGWDATRLRRPDVPVSSGEEHTSGVDDVLARLQVHFRRLRAQTEAALEQIRGQLQNLDERTEEHSHSLVALRQDVAKVISDRGRCQYDSKSDDELMSSKAALGNSRDDEKRAVSEPRDKAEGIGDEELSEFRTNLGNLSQAVEVIRGLANSAGNHTIKAADSLRKELREEQGRSLARHSDLKDALEELRREIASLSQDTASLKQGHDYLSSEAKKGRQSIKVCKEHVQNIRLGILEEPEALDELPSSPSDGSERGDSAAPSAPRPSLAIAGASEQVKVADLAAAAQRALDACLQADPIQRRLSALEFAVFGQGDAAEQGSDACAPRAQLSRQDVADVASPPLKGNDTGALRSLQSRLIDLQQGLHAAVVEAMQQGPEEADSCGAPALQEDSLDRSSCKASSRVVTFA